MTTRNYALTNDLVAIAGQASCYGVAEELLETEFGGQFHADSLDVDYDGNGFTLQVEVPFTLINEKIEVGDKVVFDKWGNVDLIVK